MRKTKKKAGRLKPVHKTTKGSYFVGKAEEILAAPGFQNRWSGEIDLILTSPPFPLNSKKKYGNLTGEKYLAWISQLAPLFEKLLSPKGSLVIELGNSWQPGRPTQSLLTLKSLLTLASREEIGGLRLIQEFVCYNPARLPSPAQWVTVNRVRTVDSYTHVWWLAKSDHPEADNTRVTRPYSDSMRRLLKAKKFNAGTRPSQHTISKKGFLRRHRGSIAHNFIETEQLDPRRSVRLPNAFSFSNTASNGFFDRVCKKKKITPHPARMPVGLAAFFIQFLTKKNAIILDPFAGSNTTGFAAQILGRKWISIDAKSEYGVQSKLRFSDPILKGGNRGPRKQSRSS